MKHQKIDQFTILLAIILIACAGLLIFSFRGIFHAVSISYDVTVSNASTEKVNQVKFDEAKNFGFGEKNAVPLQITGNVLPTVSVTLTPTP